MLLQESVVQSLYILLDCSGNLRIQEERVEQLNWVSVHNNIIATLHKQVCVCKG